MGEPTYRTKRGWRLASCIALALLAGCAEASAKLGWVDETLYGNRAVGPAKVAYAGVDRVKVFNAPDPDSPVEGVLTLHEQVKRYQSAGGFAFVEAAGNVWGWVPEQQLVVTRPRAQQPAAEPTPTEAGAPEPAPGTEPPAPAPDEGPERSVFDPY